MLQETYEERKVTAQTSPREVGYYRAPAPPLTEAKREALSRRANSDVGCVSSHIKGSDEVI